MIMYMVICQIKEPLYAWLATNGNLLKENFFPSDRSVPPEVRLKWQMEILEVCENGSEPVEQITLLYMQR